MASEISERSWGELIEFVRGLPDPEVLRRWPPGATVRAKEGVVLLVPAPGVVGQIARYDEEAGQITTLGVLAPVTIPHPEHGWGAAEPGDVVMATCRQEWLELVDRGVLSAELLDRAIAEATT